MKRAGDRKRDKAREEKREQEITSSLIMTKNKEIGQYEVGINQLFYSDNKWKLFLLNKQKTNPQKMLNFGKNSHLFNFVLNSFQVKQYLENQEIKILCKIYNKNGASFTRGEMR